MMISEEEAYRTLQRESQQRRKSMKEIAEAVLLMDNLKRRSGQAPGGDTPPGKMTR